MLTYNLEQRNDEPKYYYIYKMIRRDIERGKLKKGEKLPSKRSLAEHLGISLITVENAYQMLKDEGYIEPRERSGYYVCEIHVRAESATAYASRDTGRNRRWTIAECSTFQLSIFPVF